MLLPAKAEDLPKPEEGAQLTMELDGKVPNMVAVSYTHLGPFPNWPDV